MVGKCRGFAPTGEILLRECLLREDSSAGIDNGIIEMEQVWSKMEHDLQAVPLRLKVGKLTLFQIFRCVCVDVQSG